MTKHMQTTYTSEFKEQLLKKLLLDDGPSVAELSEQTGVGKSTLWAWLRQRRQGVELASGGPRPATGKPGNKNKLAALIATASMNEAERTAWCREQGLYVRQLDAWRRAFETADLDSGSHRGELARERQRRRILERELQRKELALAETAALLVLSKKAQAIWGVDADA